MRDMLKVQEFMDICLDQRDEELHQLCSQSQVDGAQCHGSNCQDCMQKLFSFFFTRFPLCSPCPPSLLFNFHSFILHHPILIRTTDKFIAPQVRSTEVLVVAKEAHIKV